MIPIGAADREVTVDREVLRAALQRTSILSNEKYRGVRVEVAPNLLRISAHNPEQEEAQEEVADTHVDGLAIGFNVTYLLEALSALRSESVVLQLRDANSSALVRGADSGTCTACGHAAASVNDPAALCETRLATPGFPGRCCMCLHVIRHVDSAPAPASVCRDRVFAGGGLQLDYR